MSKRIEAYELVHLVGGGSRRYQVLLQPGSDFSFTHGKIAHDDVIGLEEGDTVTSSLGERLIVLRPTMSEYIAKMKKGSQIVYPKDIAAILMLADIFPGARVLEAGTGSGALTIALLRAVGDTGVVISYERRPEFQAIAEQNIERFFRDVKCAGGSGKLILKTGDVYESVEEREVDRVILDLPEPWRALRSVEQALRPGGIMLCYNPTVLQIYKLTKRIERKYGHCLRVTGVYEVGMREWEIKGRSMRPQHRAIVHTGFIFVARKIYNGDER